MEEDEISGAYNTHAKEDANNVCFLNLKGNAHVET
jgi:hypothetical protein